MMRFALMRPTLTVLLLLPLGSSAQEAPAPEAGVEAPVEGRRPTVEDPVGSVVALATLPEGATALYGFAGVPEVGVGFRQGIGGAEVEARARLNWFRLAAVLEVAGRRRLVESGALQVAPVIGLGVVLDSGATYLDEDNFSAVLLRVSPGLVASWRVADTAALVGLVDLPLDWGLSPGSARRFQALGGGGVELYVGGNVSLLAAGQLGVETFRERSGEGVTRLGYSVRVGLGTRLF